MQRNACIFHFSAPPCTDNWSLKVINKSIYCLMLFFRCHRPNVATPIYWPSSVLSASSLQEDLSAAESSRQLS